MRFAYPVNVREERDGVTVTCPDIPEMIATGDTRAAALAHAPDALVSALSFYVDDNRPLPPPSPARGRIVIAVSALEAAKLALHDTMDTASVSNSDLARLLGVDEKTVRRLRDPLHRSRIDAVEAALQVLGRRLEVSVLKAG